MTRVPNSELDVLQTLWRHPKQTAKEIADSLKKSGKSVGISSVQTLLRRLETRGLVQRDEEAKAFRFSAACEPNTVRAAHARDLVDRMFGGAISGFVTQLIDDEEVSDEELRELRDLVDSKLKERKKK
jgi:BlaI family penicillinase repressor